MGGHIWNGIQKIHSYLASCHYITLAYFAYFFFFLNNFIIPLQYIVCCSTKNTSWIQGLLLMFSLWPYNTILWLSFEQPKNFIQHIAVAAYNQIFKAKFHNNRARLQIHFFQVFLTYSVLKNSYKFLPNTWSGPSFKKSANYI